MVGILIRQTTTYLVSLSDLWASDRYPIIWFFCLIRVHRLLSKCQPFLMKFAIFRHMASVGIYRPPLSTCRAPLSTCKPPLSTCRAPLSTCKPPLSTCRAPGGI